jgi:sodium transport system permease protein
MNWSNVRLILAREIRDQLRDRRTMFMIFIVPILTYPFLGMIGLEMSQFVSQKITRVLVVGASDLPAKPALVENGEFAEGLFRRKGRTRLLELHFPGGNQSRTEWEAKARSAVEEGTEDAALIVPPDFGTRIDAYRKAVQQGEKPPEVPKPQIIYTTAVERSQLACDRLRMVLDRWNDELAKSFLAAAGVPEWSMGVVDLDTVDLAQETGYRGAAMWSKILPVLLMLWALVGAFYPAVDLCAGEKERGTLETLLSSPAARSEIVLGKLVTIMLFSSVTAALNLLSVAATGPMMFSQLPGFGPPPALSPVWLGLALIPASALFSALSLALAAFARSTKEGQYYLMPLMAVTIPLAILPAAAGLELTLGNSLIPVTGLVLLLRAALEGTYWQVLQFVIPVLAITLAACFFAIRWAVEQFNSESVLFREGERLDVRLWMHQLLEDRGPTPTPAGAVFCGVVILVIHFFMSLRWAPPADFARFAVTVAVTQLVVVVTPALLMTVMLTRSPRQTLLLRWPRWGAIAATALLAVVLHPAAHVLQKAVMHLYPLSEEMQEALAGLESLFAGAPWWQIVMVVATAPAVCEELAFRGFIFTGLRNTGSPWRAICVSAVFFGLSHGILQQSLIACLIGVLLGWLALRTGSILPGMVFHLVHNSLGVLVARAPDWLASEWPSIAGLVRPAEHGGVAFAWPVVLAGGLAGLLIIAWLSSTASAPMGRKYDSPGQRPGDWSRAQDSKP